MALRQVDNLRRTLIPGPMSEQFTEAIHIILKRLLSRLPVPKPVGKVDHILGIGQEQAL